MPRRRPDFESGEAGTEAAKIKKFSDAGGLKSSGCPTPAETDYLGYFGIKRLNLRPDVVLRIYRKFWNYFVNELATQVEKFRESGLNEL